MNIYDIAKKAGVSSATVSRVINNNKNVSAKSREKVLRIIKEAEYTPNVFARGLNLNTIKTVGVICPVISDINHAKPVSLLERLLRDQSFDMLLCCTDHRSDSKAGYMNLLINKRVDAIILIGLTQEEVRHSAQIAEFAKIVPIFVVNAIIEANNVYCVACEEGEVITQVMDDLYRQGCRQIMYINDSNTYSAANKLLGYRQGLQKNGLSEILIQVEDADDEITLVCALLREYLSNHSVPDAILAADDILLLGARRVLDDMDVSIPLIGCNNSRFSNCCRPEITTIDNNMESMCATATQLLMDVLAGKKTASQVKVNAQLVERDTYQRSRT